MLAGSSLFGATERLQMAHDDESKLRQDDNAIEISGSDFWRQDEELGEHDAKRRNDHNVREQCPASKPTSLKGGHEALAINRQTGAEGKQYQHNCCEKFPGSTNSQV
jgi:hypothetical protein